MALSIGVNSGSKIKVGESTVEVVDILTPTLIAITVDDSVEIMISDQERIEIMPSVFVFAGVGGAGVGNRLAFEAPREIPIHPGRGGRSRMKYHATHKVKLLMAREGISAEELNSMIVRSAITSQHIYNRRFLDWGFSSWATW